MIHLYYGDGKGKTTAACGLAVRAAGAGQRVLFAQLFKNGDSSELLVLSKLQNVTVFLPQEYRGRYKNMDEAQRALIGESYRAFLCEVCRQATRYDLIVLDEVVSAYNYGVLDRAKLLSFLQTEGPRREIVLTGRAPQPELLALADYATEMRKEKHPFDRGIKARKGIEF